MLITRNRKGGRVGSIDCIFTNNSLQLFQLIFLLVEILKQALRTGVVNKLFLLTFCCEFLQDVWLLSSFTEYMDDRPAVHTPGASCSKAGQLNPKIKFKRHCLCSLFLVWINSCLGPKVLKEKNVWIYRHLNSGLNSNLGLVLTQL